MTPAMIRCLADAAASGRHGLWRVRRGWRVVGGRMEDAHAPGTVAALVRRGWLVVDLNSAFVTKAGRRSLAAPATGAQEEGERDG